MDDYVAAFLAASTYAETTKTSYRYALSRLGEFLAGKGLTIDDLTGPLFLQWVNGQGWGNNMRRLGSYAVRAFVLWLGHGREHPVFAIKPPRDNAAPGRALDIAALRSLMESFDLSKPIGWRNLAIVAVMADTGLRASEVCRLEVIKVNMIARRFTVLVKRDRWQEKIFCAETAKVLAVWLAHREKIAQPRVKTVFVSVGGLHRGLPLTRDGLKVEFAKFGDRAKIGHISPHDMRRTMAVLLTEAGAPTRMAQELGGWEDLRTFQRYTQTLRPGQIDQYSAAEKLLKQLFEAKAPDDRTTVL